MKKMFVMLAMFCLCFQTIAVYAATPDFSGDWELDVSRSTLPETMPIESMTMKVSQTEKDLQVESIAKMNQARSGMRRGGGAQTATYSLEGKETLADVGSGMMAGKETRKASVTTDGKLNLNIIRNFKNEMGDVTIKTNEIWELLDAGKTLKVTRYMETPRGATNAEMYFTKKALSGLTVKGDSDALGNQANTADGVPRKISGGILNGKATSLPKPAYPAAAQAVNASGAINVQVTIDEQGNIISASAVSGHPLLRQAAEQAARRSQFAPTLLQGVPVQVTGVIVYNFTP
jgi:TonB family protein